MYYRQIPFNYQHDSFTYFYGGLCHKAFMMSTTNQPSLSRGRDYKRKQVEFSKLLIVAQLHVFVLLYCLYVGRKMYAVSIEKGNYV